MLKEASNSNETNIYKYNINVDGICLMIWYKFLQIRFVSLRPNVEAVQQAKQESRVLELTGAKNIEQLVPNTCGVFVGSVVTFA